MDQLLRRENLDLRLTPYRVLATSSRHGMVEFVDASAIAEILSTEGSILSFFRRHNPQVTPDFLALLKLPNVELAHWKGFRSSVLYPDPPMFRFYKTFLKTDENGTIVSG
jgi:hypothetical protein